MTTALDPSRARAPRSAALVLAAVFLAGALAGAATYHFFVPPRVLRRVSVRVAPQGAALYDQLGLSAAQHARVDSILHALQPRTDSLLGSAIPRLRVIVEAADSSIRATLTDDQRRRLDSLTRAP
jgi:hypothetical protein